jgi:hypothetical protein
MNFIKKYFTIFILFLSGSLEIWGLHSILGLTPYIFVAIPIAFFKFFQHQAKAGFVAVLYILTIFFAIQNPLKSVIYHKNVVELQNEKNMLQQKSVNLENERNKHVRNGAYGALKDIRKDILINNEKLAQLDYKLNKMNSNIYVAIIQILVIVCIEIMLYLSLFEYYLNKKRSYTPRKSKIVDSESDFKESL